MTIKTITMRTENPMGFHKDYREDTYLVHKERDGFLRAVGQNTGQKFIVQDKIPDNETRLKNKEVFKIKKLAPKNPCQGFMDYIVEIIDTNGNAGV